MPVAHGIIRARAIAVGLLLSVVNGCALPAPPPPAPPLSVGQARVWFYREFLPDDTKAIAAVAMNGSTVGYAVPGTNFYKDVPAGAYHVTVESWGRDLYQSQDLALAPGDQQFIKIMSLPSWAEERRNFERPTYYARAVTPYLASLELPLTTFRGGN